jgi:predicted phosphodiesterase
MPGCLLPPTASPARVTGPTGMRVAILSDVHSNLEALTAVLRAVDGARVDRVVSLGDIVGYGASPNACCELVRSVAEVTLLGNHDAAVAGRSACA